MSNEKKSAAAILAGLVAGAYGSMSLAGVEPPAIPQIKGFNVIPTENGSGEVNGVLVGITFPRNTLFATMPIGFKDGKVLRRHDFPTRVGSWGKVRQVVDNESNDLVKMPLVGVHVGLPKDPTSTTLLSNVPAGYVERFDEETRTLDDVFKNVVKGLTPELVEGLKKTGHVFEKDIKGVMSTLLAIPVSEQTPLFIFGYLGDDGKPVFNPDEDRWSFMQRNPSAPVKGGRTGFGQNSYQVRGGPIQTRAKQVAKEIWKQVAENEQFKATMDQFQGKPRTQRMGANTFREQRKAVADDLLDNPQEQAPAQVGEKVVSEDLV